MPHMPPGGVHDGGRRWRARAVANSIAARPGKASRRESPCGLVLCPWAQNLEGANFGGNTGIARVEQEKVDVEPGAGDYRIRGDVPREVEPDKGFVAAIIVDLEYGLSARVAVLVAGGDICVSNAVVPRRRNAHLEPACDWQIKGNGSTG